MIMCEDTCNQSRTDHSQDECQHRHCRWVHLPDLAVDVWICSKTFLKKMKRSFDTCLKGRDGRKKEKRQSNHHDVSQREKETCINACGASNLQLEINSGTCTDKMLIKSDRLSFLWQCGTFREELLPPSAFPQACRSCGEDGKTTKLSVVGSHSPNHCVSAVGSPSPSHSKFQHSYACQRWPMSSGGLIAPSNTGATYENPWHRTGPS